MKKSDRAEIERRLRQWSLPPPERAGIEWRREEDAPDLPQLARRIRDNLAQAPQPADRARRELAAVDWLWELVRGNIKRGRVFALEEVLQRGYADCLGYAWVLAFLSTRFGLDIGVVEVVIDNAGRAVPHAANLLRLADGQIKLMDLWYGSKDIRHQRIAAMVKGKEGWRVRDLDWEELGSAGAVKGLPLKCIEAIACYIRGNRHLERGLSEGDREELGRAIQCYTRAIQRYPENARFYFNRAVARERRGEREEAARDYAQALKDEASQIRVLAREHEEIVRLIELDEKGLSPQEQEVYLRRRGFLSGQPVTAEEVAREYGISPQEVERIVAEVEGERRG
jgi:tetratricopeptide (TPR) repeat protein